MKTKLSLPVLFYLLFLQSHSGFAQTKVVRTESFDETVFPPFGWNAGKLSGTDLNNYCQRVTTGTSPTCTPHSGAGMLRYRSGYMFNAGEQTYLASKRYDLTNNPGTAVVRFWLYKNNYNNHRDSITVYINDSASANPGKASMTKIMGPFSRDTTAAGAGWKEYAGIIPSGYNSSSAYLIFVFTNRETSGTGANIYLDDISIETYPKPMSFISSEVFYQETIDVSRGSLDNPVIGIKVITDGAKDSIKVDSIVTNATGSSNLAIDIINGSAKIWFTGGSNYFTINNNQFGTGVSVSYFRDKFTKANFFLENGENYFWLTYNISQSAANGDCVDAQFNGIYYHDKPYNTTPDSSLAPLVNSLSGCRVIGSSLCGGIVPTMIQGTSANGYTNNDYINRVYLRGANSSNTSYPYLDNSLNDNGPSVAPWNGGPAPFSAHPPDYQMFSQWPNPVHANITAVLAQGSFYSAPTLLVGNPVGSGIALQCGKNSSSNYLAAWIDFNNDGDFLDSAEQIIPSTGLVGLSWVFGAVKVPTVVSSPSPGVKGPAGIAFGNIKMRVREVFANNNIDPCQSGYNYGETEDYILTVIPGCIAGVKLWLGYSDDWNNPGNWCGGTPTINDIALIDEVGYWGGNQNGAAYEPVIHAGTVATAKTIRISDTDSLTIDANDNSSLQIADSLEISYNTPNGGNGYLKVNDNKIDTVQISNANLSFNITPFMGTKKEMRMQIVYTKADFLNKGMTAGDIVDQLIFHIRKKTNPTVLSYNGFTIKYATVDSTWSKWPQGPPSSLAPVTSAYTTIFGPVNLDLQAAVPDTQGTLILTLIPDKFIWNGVSDIVIEFCFDNSLIQPNVQNDNVTQTQTIGQNQTMWMNSSGVSPSGCVLNWPLALGVVAVTTQYRPNITFKYRRIYNTYPINITGNNGTAGQWINNGIFIPGNSKVTFSGSLNQTIGGANATTFNKLVINKSGGKVILDNDVSVDSTLKLNGGKMELNKNTLTLNYSSSNAVQRTAGGIISETTNPPYGIIKWKIKNNYSAHVFPFITNSSDYIPLTYTVTVGNVGNVSVSTYPSDNNRKPFPTNVNNINDSLGNNNSAYTVKRFWDIDKSGTGGTADIKFSYRNSEAPSPIVKSNIKPNRYNYSGNVWQRFSLPVTNVVGGNVSSSAISNLTGSNLTNAAWALSDASSPLRVQDEGQPFAEAYPNPFNESFIVNWDGTESYDLVIFDLAGRKVYEQKVYAGDLVMPGKQIIPGSYIVQLKNNSRIEQFRMIKTE